LFCKRYYKKLGVFSGSQIQLLFTCKTRMPSFTKCRETRYLGVGEVENIYISVWKKITRQDNTYQILSESIESWVFWDTV